MKKMYNTLRLLLTLLLGLQIGATAQTSTYFSSGAYTYTVPAGVTGINVTIKGAQGGINSDEIDYSDRGGYGGCVTAFITVTPGQVLDVNVGGCGSAGTTTAGGAGGFNGGGAGSYGTSIYAGGGGGGASDIRLSTGAITDRLVVAAGGGGAGINCGSERGGDGGSSVALGGGETGQAGCGTETGGGGGIYGSLLTGGAGGACGTCGGSPGTAGDPSNGGTGGFGSAGGGGGGGWSGGGGGQWTGGGGGSDYYSATGVTMLVETRGCNASCGSVQITAGCVIGNITGSNQVCQGITNAPFTGVTAGGTWTSSNSIVAAIGSTTGALMGVNGGVAIITYSLSALCFTTYPVTVNATPSAITGTFVLCVNQTTTLHDLTSGGEWTSSDGTIAGIGTGTGTVTANGAGTCTITFEVIATGCLTTASFSVNPIPAAIMGPDTVCVGSSATITDVSPGGTWSDVGVHASIVGAGTTATILGLSAGTTDVVSYTYLPTGCAAAFPITVNPLPSNIGGPAFVCMGSTATETDASGLGSWTIIDGSGSASIGSSSGIVTPISIGTVTVVYTLPTSCSKSRTLTVDPTPAAISPSAPEICVGTTIILTDVTTGGTWTSVSGGVGSIVGSGTTATVTGNSGGTTLVSYTLGSCPATVVVTVDPLPTAIAGPTQVCVGDCGDIYTSGPGSGSWSSSSTTVATIDAVTGSLCAVAAGTTTLSYTFVATGCVRTVNVTVNATPTITPTSPQVCLGYTTTLNGTPAGGTWNTSGGSISVASGSGVVTGNTLGTGIVTYTAATTCTVTATVTVNPLPTPITLTSGTNPMCVGQTSTLSSGGGVGTWTSSLTAAETINPVTGVATGIAGGIPTDTFTITATGCYATYDMNVNALPMFSTAPPAAMCETTTATVTVASGAGIWSSSNTAVATAITTGTGPSGTLTAIAAGITDICYTFTAAPGTCKTCQTMDVVPALTPISGPTQVCTGASITLTSGPTGGMWTSSTGATTVVGAGATVTVTGAMTAGSPSTITYSLGTCQATYLVTVNQSPNAITVTAPNTLNICQGLTTTMCTTGPGPFGYTWTSGTPAVSTLTSAGLCATATGISAGTSLIKYTNNITGCFSSATLVVTNGVAAITGPNFVCMGATAIETETITGNWSSSSGAVATVTGGAPGPMVNNTTVTPVAPGVFTLTFLGSSGCTATKLMTVDALPSNVVTPLGSTNLCPGGTVELTAGTGTGYTYQWGSPGAIAGATAATYLAGSAGTYVVTVTAAGPCSATSAGTAITVNPVTATVSPAAATTACASAGLTLTASAATTYQWLLAGVAVSGAMASTFTPTVTGNYSVEETNAFGCVGTSAAVSITLASSPAGVVAVTGSLNLCRGQSVTLTADAGAGYTYQWYNGGLGAPIAGATNMAFTDTGAGNFFVVDVNTTGCSTTSGTSVVKVSPLPLATLDTPTSPIFCSGGSVSLTAPPSATNLFQWFKNGVAITGATNAVYVASGTGNYTVQIDSPVTGCIATSRVQAVTDVTVPTLDLITSSSFCWGSSADLAAVVVAGAGTVGYQWQVAGVNIAGATNNTYPATVTGSYSVEIFVHGGLCNETSSPVTVTERPLPNPLVTDTLPNVIAQRYFVTYQWYLNNILITGATSFYTPIIGNGTYKVKVTDTNGCQSVSTGFPVSGWVSNSVGSVNGNSEIKIYPNPAQDALHIDAPMAVRAVISSMDGRVLIDQQAATEVNISSLANGIYSVKLFDSNGNVVKVDKMVKDSN